MLDYFFCRQYTEIITEDGDAMYQAQVALLNHIKTNYTTEIPTVEILYSKVEAAAEDSIKPLPAIYSLFAAGDIHYNEDNPWTIPLVFIAASNHHDKDTHFSECSALTVGVSEWLQANSFYSGSEANYRVLSPISKATPYKVEQRYTIMVALVDVIELK